MIYSAISVQPKNNFSLNRARTDLSGGALRKERPYRESCTMDWRSTVPVARTSWANQLRVLITAAAYVLMQEMRLAATGTSCERAQVSTLRDRLIKLGAWIETSVRRIVVHLPKSAPHRCEWQPYRHSRGSFGEAVLLQ